MSAAAAPREQVRHCIAGAAPVALATMLIVAAGCETYRIERHTRPSYYASASTTPLPDRVTLADGTVIIYETPEIGADVFGGAATEKAPDVLIREESENGSVVLRCIIPDHVIANMMTCIRNEEYELMWEQLVAERTRRAYEAEGKGLAEFTEGMQRYRREIMTTLNRMSFGLHTPDTILESDGRGGVRLRLSPFISSDFRFRQVDMASENGLLRLAQIH